MTDEKLEKKEELEKRAYKNAQEVKSDIPVNEYLSFILLKKEFNLPLTEVQSSFLELASSGG